MLRKLALALIALWVALSPAAASACDSHGMLVMTGHGLRCILVQHSSGDIIFWYFTGGYW